MQTSMHTYKHTHSHTRPHLINVFDMAWKMSWLRYCVFLVEMNWTPHSFEHSSTLWKTHIWNTNNGTRDKKSWESIESVAIQSATQEPSHSWIPCVSWKRPKSHASVYQNHNLTLQLTQCEHFCYARNEMTILWVVSLSRKHYQEETGDSKKQFLVFL